MDLKFSSTKKLERILKTLEKRQKKLLENYHEQIELLLQNPKLGKSLSGDLQEYFSYEFNFKGVALRIVYKYIEAEDYLIFVYFGTRENFYKELKKYLFD